MNNDSVFLQDIHTEPKCPEYNGFNTRQHVCQEAAMLLEPNIDVASLPLIDPPPAHYDTIKTAIDRGLSLMKTAGDDVLIVTADQQLYKKLNCHGHNVLSTRLFQICIPVLGGMHMLMNCRGP